MITPFLRSTPAPGAAAPCYMVYDRSAPQIVVPSLASAPLIAPGLSWTWGSYAQITAGLAYDFLCMGATPSLFLAVIPPAPLFTFFLQFEIATGAAGSEVARAYGQIGGMAHNPSPNTEGSIWANTRETPFQPFVIPAGTRIAARAAFSVTYSPFFALFLYGFNDSTFPASPTSINYNDYWHGDLGLTPETMLTPQLSSLTVTSGAASWTWGSWVQVWASAAADTLIRGVIAGLSTAGQTQIQLGIGPAGSEVPFDTLAWGAHPLLTTGPLTGYVRLARPLQINIGERLAVRAASRFPNAAIPTNVAYEALA